MKKITIKLIILGLVIINTTQAQQIYALKSECNGDFPHIKWYSALFQDASNFEVYRTGLEETNFQLVNTLHGKDLKGDSLIYWIIDTTLTEKALYKYFITVPYVKDSVVRSEITYGHNLGPMPAPQVIKFNANAVDGEKAINLTWKLNYNFTVNSITILRSSNYDEGYEVLTKLSVDTESYTDYVDVANEAYFYSIVIHDFFGYQSPSIRIHGISNFKQKPIRPQNFEALNTNNRAELSWKRVGQNIVGYKVYRKINQNGSFFPLGKMFYQPQEKIAYIDSTINNYKNKDISYYVVSISDGFVESNPSDTIQIHVQGEIMKGSPQKCDYIIDSLNRVMLIWTSQEEDINVKGYNVYRSIKDGNKTKLNKQLIPHAVNYFVDKENTGENEYYYEIETVSTTNTPSLSRTSLQINRHEAIPHLILSLTIIDKGIQIEGLPLDDINIKEIILYKQTNSENPKQLKKLSPTNIKYTDINVKSGDLCNYSAVAVYKDSKMVTVNGGVIVRF